MTAVIEVRNPYTGKRDYSFEDPAPADIVAAASHVRRNQPIWAAFTLDKRLKCLEAFAAAISRNRDAILAALIQDTGRITVANMELDALDAFIQRTLKDAPAALAASQPQTASVPIVEGSSNHKPYGVVGNISPWNFPIILSFLDTFPALAAGNAVLIKPSEVTPRWVEPMRSAIAECPELADVLGIVVGTGQAGAAVVEQVDAVVFTGSVTTGRKVAEAAAKQFIPAFLELGGKDPAIVLASADIALAARTTTFCSVQSAGQACQSLERIYVAREHYEEFVDLAVTTAENLEINYPDMDTGVVGPFIFEDQGAIVLRQLADAKGAGATIHCGGELLNHGGFWMRPTVVTDVTHEMSLMQDETFGPVMCIMPFDSEDEAIRLANDSQYGLSAAVFAGTVDEGREFARTIHAGAISVNDAALTVLIHEFEHDAFGLSGMGASRAGLSAYTRFTRKQAVMVNVADQPLLPTAFGKTGPN
ncbi:MAG: aldehyde dehydrogenase family protein [Gammaproteobacteria bacterium]|nr:aldehyde dehydrogenase family protein [Gammaproteobacteria bacterium]MCP4091476.1 aldehyde dehydrogenase family protein [Gammaproteobacteria bacterium]MCP4275386.1 aldehyde dehydrogenase family protein [Gammaproteobacteria bacterium]MCP4832274.1 aldehyde dehydrogenase family protein [Gammaproteobacteria bacterium]MCP4928151.1 aldehyde dehydrogenase family protein [Gammaproteobacteria bacterium]